MVVKAYILVTVETPRTKDVVSALRRNKKLSEVHEVLGPYDIVVEMETNDLSEVTRTLREEVRPIPGVRNTLTCVSME
jgi:DNA-binding Lrp family transcriptional regulator